MFCVPTILVVNNKGMWYTALVLDHGMFRTLVGTALVL